MGCLGLWCVSRDWLFELDSPWLERHAQALRAEARRFRRAQAMGAAMAHRRDLFSGHRYAVVCWCRNTVYSANKEMGSTDESSRTGYEPNSRRLTSSPTQSP